MDISTSCNKCTKRKTCWVRWELIGVLNKINEHPSEILSISGAQRKVDELRIGFFGMLAEKCLHYTAQKEKFV